MKPSKGGNSRIVIIITTAAAVIFNAGLVLCSDEVENSSSSSLSSSSPPLKNHRLEAISPTFFRNHPEHNNDNNIVGLGDYSSVRNATIDDIITPSDTCKEIVAKFASAVSNFTHCSVTNSRPIHLCGWCIGEYLSVRKYYHDLFVTIDEKGNPCKEYFTNLDRIEIVSDAYNYVHNLWTKGKCDYCFQHMENGTLIPEVTEDVSNFLVLYEVTKTCFNDHMLSNSTCQECKSVYEGLNMVYIDMVAKYGDNVCLDLVDTMNTTRELWSDFYHCTPPRNPELWLHVAMACVGSIPVVFYFLAYILSTKQELRIFQQHRVRRISEIFAITSNSGNSEASGFISSRPDRSPTVVSSASVKKDSALNT